MSSGLESGTFSVALLFLKMDTEFHQLMDDPFGRQYKIDHVCIDRILRHLIETCRMMMLRKCNTALLFDGLEPKCAVFPCTGQDNADSLTLDEFQQAS